MVALAFMSTESSCLIRGVMGKSLGKVQAYRAVAAPQEEKRKWDIFLQVDDPYHGWLKQTEGEDSQLFS